MVFPGLPTCTFVGGGWRLRQPRGEGEGGGVAYRGSGQLVQVAAGDAAVFQVQAGQLRQLGQQIQRLVPHAVVLRILHIDVQ